MEITVTSPEGEELANGTLAVDTSVNPNTATFTPDGGTETNCTGVVWTSNANGAVGFTFQVGSEGNGDFPAGPGPSYSYRFNGTQQANGNPKGNVNWPTASPGPAADEDVTWQAGSTGEPFAASQGAS
jgi:hypothetical protein